MEKRTALILHNDEIGWAAARATLQERDDMEVVGNVRTRDAALYLAAAHQIDLLFASNRLAGESSQPTLSELRAASCPTTLTALFVNGADPDELEGLGQLGLAACCEWEELSTTEAINAALAAILTERLVVGTRTAAYGSCYNVYRTMSTVRNAVKVSHIDRQILTLLAGGFTAQEIALQVNRAPHTVENRLLDLRIKFEARNSVQLVHIAHRLSLHSSMG